MACNVYLTFFHKYDSGQLRQLEWKYVICCYGLPFMPSFAYFFIRSQSHGRVYGSAIVSHPPSTHVSPGSFKLTTTLSYGAGYPFPGTFSGLPCFMALYGSSSF